MIRYARTLATASEVLLKDSPENAKLMMADDMANRAVDLINKWDIGGRGDPAPHHDEDFEPETGWKPKKPGAKYRMFQADIPLDFEKLQGLKDDDMREYVRSTAREFVREAIVDGP